MQQILENLASLGRQRLMIMAAAAAAITLTLVMGFVVLSSPDRAAL